MIPVTRKEWRRHKGERRNLCFDTDGLNLSFKAMWAAYLFNHHRYSLTVDQLAAVNKTLMDAVADNTFTNMEIVCP
jgi:hypothetical protein